MRTTPTTDCPIYIFGKDQDGKFIFCNEPFAEAMGADSPAHAIGKTDFQMCWRDLAPLYRKGDIAVMSGNIWHNVREKQLHIDGTIYNILVSKYPLIDNSGKIKGIVGSFTKILSNNINTTIKTNLKREKNRIYLGANLSNEYFTKREYEVFQQLLLSKDIKQIAQALNIRPKTVETHVNAIKTKLQCNYKNKIVTTAVRLGLVHIQQET